MAEGLNQDEDSEYQELLEEKYPHGEPSFLKMKQGANSKKKSGSQFFI